jgi:magnesium-transporting ATPase (P-type)
MKGGKILNEIIIWIGVVIFVALIIGAVLLYFQSEGFDKKYKKDIEIIRAIKTQKLKVLIMGFYEQETSVKNTKDDFSSIENFKESAKRALESNKNLNMLMKKSADLKMWFDYLPRAKEFLVNAGLWLFLIGIAVLAFCLAIWAELHTVGEVRYSGYLSFIWILMSINLFKNILRYNLVTNNINKHMDMLREGEVDNF